MEKCYNSTNSEFSSQQLLKQQLEFLETTTHQSHPKKTVPKHRRTVKDATGKDIRLQLSEWLVWPLTDTDMWHIVPCPCGIRCLLLAYRGRTEIYSKSGRRLSRFKSQLPGDATAQKTCTVLDCIYDDKQNALYVLDALYFHGHELLGCTAEFRYFWLQSQFGERHELSVRNIGNEKPLHLLPHYDAGQEEQLVAAFMKYPHFKNNEPQLDGFLFYHKESYYIFGRTPLIMWIYAFMVTDVLGFRVNENYVKPDNYLSPMQYLAEFEGKLAKKNYRNAFNKMKETLNKSTNSLKRHFISAFDEGDANYMDYDDDDDGVNSIYSNDLEELE